MYFSSSKPLQVYSLKFILRWQFHFLLGALKSCQTKVTRKSLFFNVFPRGSNLCSAKVDVGVFRTRFSSILFVRYFFDITYNYFTRSGNLIVWNCLHCNLHRMFRFSKSHFCQDAGFFVRLLLMKFRKKIWPIVEEKFPAPLRFLRLQRLPELFQWKKDSGLHCHIIFA